MLINSNLVLQTNSYNMTIKPLNLFRETCQKALSDVPKSSKPFQSFIIEIMELYQTIPQRINFLQMGRYGLYCESRFRQNFSRSFDWLSFNIHFAKRHSGHRTAIAIDPSYINKSGKFTPGMGYFWSGCTCAYKRGLEILGIALVDADTRDATFLKSAQTFTQKHRGFKPYCTKGMKYSASSKKMLIHNAAIIEIFILMFGKLPNSHLNNTIFKELLL